MISAAVLLPVFLAHFAAAVSPGPSVLMAMRIAAVQGFLPGVGFAVGVGLGAMVWAAAALLGLSVVFQVLPGLLVVLKLVGAAFLIYIGIMTWRHAGDALPLADAAKPMSPPKAVRYGLFIQLTNPKPAIFFGAVFVTMVPPNTSLGGIGLILAMIGCVEVLWVSLVARVFSLPAARKTYSRVKSRVERVFGTVLAGFGLKIALT